MATTIEHVRAQLDSYLDANTEPGEIFDREAIVRDLVRTYDMVGEFPEVRFGTLPVGVLASLLIEHDLTPQSRPCRSCDADVVITRVNGVIQETDISGDIICEECWSISQS